MLPWLQEDSNYVLTFLLPQGNELNSGTSKRVASLDTMIQMMFIYKTFQIRNAVR